MGLIGIIGTIVSFIILISTIDINMNKKHKLVACFSIFGLFLLFIFMIVYDKTSPTINKIEKTYISTELENITFDEPMKITKYKKIPTRKGTIFNEDLYYEVEVYDGK